MAQVTLQGTPFNTNGDLPAVGAAAPAFNLLNAQLARVGLADFAGQKLILNIFPSIDTGTCAKSTRQFNLEAAALSGVAILTVSEDLPFALTRFCGAEGIDKLTPLSAFKSSFSADYGVEMLDGPLAGLSARAVVVIDEAGVVRYTELVGEIANEPNYAAALAALA